MKLRLSEIASIVGGELYGDDRVAYGVSIDSRTLNDGDVFFALAGTRTDGHQFVGGLGAEAAAAVTARRLSGTAVKIAQIVVTDVRKALATLARAWRESLSLTVIALTGSNGKTTVKEMLVAILKKKHAVGATQGNLNNQLGVPLTLLSLEQRCELAVIEMGASRQGEIRELCDLAKPRVSVVLNVGRAHLEGFGDIDGVARAKGEIYECLPQDGIGVVNLSSPYHEQWENTLGERQVVRFSTTKPAEPRADVFIVEHAGTSVCLSVNGEHCQFSTHLLGWHNLANAAAAAAVAHAVGVSADVIARGLEAMRPLRGRMRLIPGARQSQLIDDCYNANPTSLEAGVTAATDLPGEAWLVLGDMGELGDRAEQFHKEAGAFARTAGIKRLLTIGELARHASRAFGKNARHFDNLDELIDCLNASLDTDINVLVKGSRGSRMERVVNALAARTESEPC